MEGKILYSEGIRSVPYGEGGIEYRLPKPFAMNIVSRDIITKYTLRRAAG